MFVLMLIKSRSQSVIKNQHLPLTEPLLKIYNWKKYIFLLIYRIDRTNLINDYLEICVLTILSIPNS